MPSDLSPEPPATQHNPLGLSSHAVLSWLHELPPDSPEWEKLGAWWRALTPEQQRALELPLVERLPPGRKRLLLHIAGLVDRMLLPELEETVLFIASVFPESKGELYVDLGEVLKR